MFLESFKITVLGVAQIFILGAIGYFLVKKNILKTEGLDSLSRLIIGVTLPILIFSKLVRDFRFSLYYNWWVFPLMSVVIAAVGFAVGFLFCGFIRGAQHKRQFLSLVTFQNSGYLPLALIAALLPENKADTMFIYLFLFLLGFNLVMWSLGVYMLRFLRARRFELGSLFSPPVIATIFSLTFIFFGLHKFVPEVVLKPLSIVGDCTLPMALFVVGGNLAKIYSGRIDIKAILLVALAKLIILPLLGLLLIMKFRFLELTGLLILMQLAMPPATSLSIIISHYKKEDLLISQGIFFGHILSLITIPIFLGLYFALVMIK